MRFITAFILSTMSYYPNFSMAISSQQASPVEPKCFFGLDPFESVYFSDTTPGLRLEYYYQPSVQELDEELSGELFVKLLNSDLKPHIKCLNKGSMSFEFDMVGSGMAQHFRYTLTPVRCSNADICFYTADDIMSGSPDQFPTTCQKQGHVNSCRIVYPKHISGKANTFADLVIEMHNETSGTFKSLMSFNAVDQGVPGRVTKLDTISIPLAVVEK